MARFSLKQLYGITFGFVGLPYQPLSSEAEVQGAQRFSAIESTAKGGEVGLLGTPIMLPCTLAGTRLPNEPLITIVGEKLIVKTAVDGNDGTFKELYSTGDYQVTIQGICVNDDDPDDYPEDQVRAIREIIEQPRHVAVVNRLTSLFNIEHLAIESYSFPAVPGQIGMQAYEIRCSSDKEFQLRLRER